MQLTEDMALKLFEALRRVKERPECVNLTGKKLFDAVAKEIGLPPEETRELLDQVKAALKDGDPLTAPIGEPAPRPWMIGPYLTERMIIDAKGRPVARFFRMEDAELIIDVVNKLE